MSHIEHLDHIDARRHLTETISRTQQGRVIVVTRASDRSAVVLVPYDDYAALVDQTPIRPVHVEWLADKVTLFSPDLSLYADGATLGHATDVFFDKLEDLLADWTGGEAVETSARLVLRRVQLADGDRDLLADMFSIPSHRP